MRDAGCGLLEKEHTVQLQTVQKDRQSTVKQGITESGERW